jgi:RHS repeat-associated protein
MSETGGESWQHSNIFASGRLTATYDLSGLHYELADPLGTKRLQANIAGLVEESCYSLPFGNDLNNPPSVRCFSPSNPPPTADDATEHHFTGKERDAESGNDYFGARYYASTMGRFLSPDWSAKEEPVPYAKLDDPQTLNLYSYVGNNPLARADADGHCGEDLCIVEGGVTAYFVGAAVLSGAAAVLSTPAGQRSLSTFTSAASANFSSNVSALKSTVSGWFSKKSADKPSTLKPGPHAGEGTPARSGDRNFTPGERGAVNAEGAEKGCHTCGTTDPGTKSGNFVPDHQPPTALNPAGGEQTLYPQCLSCSRTQGGEVNAAKQQLPPPPPPPKPQPPQ